MPECGEVFGGAWRGAIPLWFSSQLRKHYQPSVVLSFVCFIPFVTISIFLLQDLAYIANPAMDPSEVDVPPLKDLTIDNITENVHLINSRCPDPRLKYLLERLVTHVHDFARETRLSTNEWMTAIQFLTQVGQICTDVRQVRQKSGLSKEVNKSDGICRNSSYSRT